MGGNRGHGRHPSIVDGVLYGADRHVARWVGQRIEGYEPEEGARALGIVRGERLVAGVAYERFNGVHVEAAIAAEEGSAWASRRALFHLFHYPFIDLGCFAISVSIPLTNRPSLNLAGKLGFEPEAVIRFAAHGGADLLVLKSYRDKCRWLRHGQEGRQRAEGTGP
ncbi:hypothetical protein [Salipiger marinus]|uniref:N-acetyltransferase domain-containing protein n=1 Tax=Salipiger marinus TaxID=555512 RepID=A0A1G8MRP9_9RHOB|nr:hypothetical protein [Salipiger marinus]SDI70523.1 hypothetical protein SAMN04487993_1008223 [Salipiger marinus]